MEYFVYIIYSEKFDKYYVGQTHDFSNRLNVHNEGRNISTAPYRPWKPAIIIKKESRSEALILEKKLKNLNKERILQFINKYKVVSPDEG